MAASISGNIQYSDKNTNGTSIENEFTTINVIGDATVGGDATITGDLSAANITATGAIQGASLSTSGNVSVAGTLTAASFSPSTLDVSGNATLARLFIKDATSGTSNSNSYISSYRSGDVDNFIQLQSSASTAASPVGASATKGCLIGLNNLSGLFKIFDTSASGFIELNVPVGSAKLTSIGNFTLDVGQFLDRSGPIVPPGCIMTFAGTALPSGWLYCDGGTYSRTTYANLFDAIGTTYGSPSGTTFRVPDLRGRVPVGRDDMGGTAIGRITATGSGIDGTVLGEAGGSESVTLTVAQMPAHTHGVQGAQLGGGGGAGFSVSNGSDTQSGSVGGDEAHRNVCPSIIVNYAIHI